MLTRQFSSVFSALWSDKEVVCLVTCNVLENIQKYQKRRRRRRTTTTKTIATTTTTAVATVKCATLHTWKCFPEPYGIWMLFFLTKESHFMLLSETMALHETMFPILHNLNLEPCVYSYVQVDRGRRT